jgi:hypothetical protein
MMPPSFDKWSFRQSQWEREFMRGLELLTIALDMDLDGQC